MEILIDASFITTFHYQFYATRVLYMSHALVQRMYVSLCRPFLRTLDFACHPYPQCVLESHEAIVLPCTLVLLSLWVGKIEPNSRNILIGH
jgi:hypothetical protein